MCLLESFIAGMKELVREAVLGKTYYKGDCCISDIDMHKVVWNCKQNKQCCNTLHVLSHLEQYPVLVKSDLQSHSTGWQSQNLT